MTRSFRLPDFLSVSGGIARFKTPVLLLSLLMLGSCTNSGGGGDTAVSFHVYSGFGYYQPWYWRHYWYRPPYWRPPGYVPPAYRPPRPHRPIATPYAGAGAAAARPATAQTAQRSISGATPSIAVQPAQTTQPRTQYRRPAPAAGPPSYLHQPRVRPRGRRR